MSHVRESYRDQPKVIRRRAKCKSQFIRGRPANGSREDLFTIPLDEDGRLLTVACESV